MLPQAAMAEDTLTLAAGTTWFGEETPMSKIFIRPVYGELYDYLVADWLAKKDTLILGTPGIGKSIFLFYVLWRLAFERPDATIVFRTRDENEKVFYVLRGNTGGERTVQKYTREPDLVYQTGVLYLLDSNLPTAKGSGRRARVLEVSSPKRSHWSPFAKQDLPAVRYMPGWTPAELETCRSSCYPAADRAKMERVVELLGGSARAAFALNVENAQSSVDEAIEVGACVCGLVLM
jgi:hypothetical protein